MDSQEELCFHLWQLHHQATVVLLANRTHDVVVLRVAECHLLIFLMFSHHPPCAGENLRRLHDEQNRFRKNFEHYCENEGLCLSRIPEEDAKTPDYMLNVSGKQIVVEVKESQLNADEQKGEEHLKKTGCSGEIDNPPGQRVRNKTDKAGKQIRARTNGTHSGMLVLFDTETRVHIHPYHILTAMFGTEQINLAVPSDPSQPSYSTGTSHGSGQKTIKNDNTSLSAIATLCTSNSSSILIGIYHNPFAAVPIEPSVFAPFSVKQYQSPDPPAGSTRDWIEI